MTRENAEAIIEKYTVHIALITVKQQWGISEKELMNLTSVLRGSFVDSIQTLVLEEELCNLNAARNVQVETLKKRRVRSQSKVMET